MNTNADLLKSLKIDRSAPPPPSRKGLWIGLGVAAAVLLLAIAGWLLWPRLTRLAVTFGKKPAPRWTLELLPKATAEQQAHLAAWLGRDAGAQGGAGEGSEDG